MAVEVLAIFIVIFILAIFAVALNIAMGEINDEIQTMPDIGNTSKEMSQDYADSIAATWDNAILMAFVLLWIGGIAAAFLIDTHPVFMGIAAILIICFAFTVPYLANAYEEFITGPGVDQAGNFPLSMWLMRHSLEYVLIVGFSILIVLYGKSRSNG